LRFLCLFAAIKDLPTVGLASSFAKASKDKSEAALHGWRPLSAFIRGCCLNLCGFAALREIFFVSICGAFGVDNGAAHLAGF
jgi:hypothetical protein